MDECAYLLLSRRDFSHDNAPHVERIDHRRDLHRFGNAVHGRQNFLPLPRVRLTRGTVARPGSPGAFDKLA